VINALPKAKATSIRLVVTRANGRVENLGLVSYWNRNPLKRWAVNLYIRLKEIIR